MNDAAIQGSIRLIGHTPVTGVPEPSILCVRSIVAGPDGSTLLTDEFNHRLVSLDRQGAFMFAIGGKGAEPGKFHYPRGIAMVESSHGVQIVVCDAWNHRIQVFNPDGAFVRQFGKIGEGPDEFNEPTAIVPTAEGNFWVLDRCNHRLKLMSLTGQVLSVIGSRMSLDNEIIANNLVDYVFGNAKGKRGLFFPQGLARLSDGRLIVADTNNRRLQIFGADGGFAATLDISTFETRPDERFYPTSVTPVSESVVMVFSPGQPAALVDVDRPWEKTRVSLPAGISCEGSPVWAEAGRRLAFRHLDASAGQISLYEIGPQVLERSPEPLSPGKGAGTLADWRSFLLVHASQAEGAQMAAFLGASLAEAEKTAQTVSEAERELMEMSGVHMGNHAELSNSRQKGLADKAIESEYSWSLFQLRTIIRKRQLAFHTLVTTIAGAATALEKAGRKDSPSAEAVKIEEVLLNELNLRLADYEGVKASLIKAVGEGMILPDPSCVMALISLIMLGDHIDYLRKSLSMIPGSKKIWTGVSILPSPLAHRRTWLLSLFTQPAISLFATLSCWKTETDSVKMIAVSAGGMPLPARLAYLKQVYHTMFGFSENQTALKLARLIAEEIKASPDPVAAGKALATGDGTGPLAKAMRLAGEEDLAKRFITAAIEANGENPHLAQMAKESRILDKNPNRLVLTKGSDATAIAGMRIKYVETIKLASPVDGLRIRPNAFCMTDSTHAVIYDHLAQTLYLLDAETGAVSILYGKPVTAMGLVAMPDGTILFAQSPDHSRPAIGCRLKTLDPKTGDVSDFAETLKCAGPQTAVSACLNADGSLWALDGENCKVWWISADRSSSRSLATPPKKYRRISARDGG
ncbi:MAG: NHL repeat-containing protein, partial [Nitrospinae bacterium]|nr:NHL repeat-containing protein [Nitrospinota bacterium]